MTFFDHISHHNNQINSSTQVLTPCGRAYKSQDASFYADRINVVPSEGGISFTQQEMKHSYTSRVYAGNAGLTNLKNISYLQPDYAILYDVNAIQTVYWRIILGAALQNASYQNFKSFLNYSEGRLNSFLKLKFGEVPKLSKASLASALEKAPHNLIRKAFTGRIRNVSESLNRLEFEEKDYYYFRQMVLARRIGVLTIDLFDRKAWQSLTSQMSAGFGVEFESLEIDTLYVSNVYDFADKNLNWTGEKMNKNNISAIESSLQDHVCIIDDKNHYTKNEFKQKYWKENLCLTQQSPIRVSAQGNGAVRLVQPLI